MLLQALARRGALHAELELGPLGGVRARRVVALGRAARRHDEVDRVVAASEGNALLAVEAARASRAGAQPPGCARSCAPRPRSWRPSSRRRGAGRGRRPRAGPRRSCSAPARRPDAAAAAALESGLLARARRALGFRHALLRAAAYEDLPEPRRAALHDLLAGALEAAARVRGRTGPPPAARGPRRRRRAQLAARRRRGARAWARWPRPPAFLREALEIRPDDPELLLELGEVEAWRSDWDAADAAFAEALGGPRARRRAGRARAHARRGLLVADVAVRAAALGRRVPRGARAARGARRAPGELLLDVLAGLAWARAPAATPRGRGPAASASTS